MPKVLIGLNTAWNLVNFRAGLIRSLAKAGYEVVASAPNDEYVSRLPDLGCRYISLPMENKGTHPLKDLLLLFRFMLIMRRERPDFYLGFTVKPNIYGSIAANFLNIPVINNIAGLGSVYINRTWLTNVVSFLYKIALKKSDKVFFQNSEDRDLFISKEIVIRDMAECIPGSGIDLTKFLPASLPSGSRIRFLLVSRMLWDKGIGEYVEAARMLRQRRIDADFYLLGFLDVQNPSAITSLQIQEWEDEGIVQYLGVSDDVRIEISNVDCVVLPSYREGVPRSLLEAAAMARPIVTTDVTGCREVVDDGVNGFLCNPRDANDLAIKMEKIVNLSLNERQQMGLLGRKKVENQFSEQVVIESYLRVLDQAMNSRKNF